MEGRKDLPGAGSAYSALAEHGVFRETLKC